MKTCTSLLMVLCVAAHSVGCRAQQTAHPSPDDRYKLIAKNVDKLAIGGRITQIRWAEDGNSLTYQDGGQRWRFDLVTRQRTEASQPPRESGGERSARSSRPARGRQRDRVTSPDGKWIAVCKDWNVILEPVESDEDTPLVPQITGEAAEELPRSSEPTAIIDVTTDGHRKYRYGSASWVYGEELNQRDGMWWSPDSKKLVFYAFDERRVPDHFITADLTKLHTRVLTEGYPKPGEPNPIANLLIYDLNTKSTISVQAPPEDDEWYTYGVRFTPGEQSSELLFFRTNRRQNLLHLTAADLKSGRTRIVLTETQETWQENSPTIQFLEDGRRFIWETERTGWKQYELRTLDGSEPVTLTRGEYPVRAIERVDEEAGLLFYTAYGATLVDPFGRLHAQLFRVGLDGSGQRQLTTSPKSHSIQFSPNGRYFIATEEFIDEPPMTVLYESGGSVTATLAQSDLTRFRDLGMTMPESFTFKADDGETDLFGVLYKPTNFDPRKKYPLLIDVYGGPLSQGVSARFSPARVECEYGFLIAEIDNRGTINRGKKFESATYLRLGDVDIKDQADGVRYLSQRPYVDATRVGIMGHSYGGYMSALAVLKYPDVFHVAVAGGTVADWRQYDTIYTERFMRTPEENPEGYDNGSCLKYVENLKGRLLLLHGMLDDNVHTNNVWQLVDSLQKANKPFEIMFFPEAGHSLGARANAYRWSFLRKHLLNN